METEVTERSISDKNEIAARRVTFSRLSYASFRSMIISASSVTESMMPVCLNRMRWWRSKMMVVGIPIPS